MCELTGIYADTLTSYNEIPSERMLIKNGYVVCCWINKTKQFNTQKTIQKQPLMSINYLAGQK